MNYLRHGLEQLNRYAARLPALLLGLALLAAALAWLLPGKHSFTYQHWPLFYPLFALLAYALLLGTARLLLPLLRRREDYYDAD